MSNLTTDIKKLQDETINNLKRSKSANTLRAYKSDLYALRVLADLELFKLFIVSS